MIDIETSSTRAYANILTIGAVKFPKNLNMKKINLFIEE